MKIAASTGAAAIGLDPRARDAGTAEAATADRSAIASGAAVAPPAMDGPSPRAGTGPAASTPTAPLQTAVLQPALRALRAMPDDIDPARVAELRDAIARGEVAFDAARLAGLIQRFHGSTP